MRAYLTDDMLSFDLSKVNRGIDIFGICAIMKI